MKKCTLCRKEKSLDDFYLCGKRYKSECKSCTKKRNRAKRAAVAYYKGRYGTLSYLDYQKEYYKNNKDRLLAKRREWEAAHPDYYKNYAERRRELYALKKAEYQAIAAMLNTEADIEMMPASHNQDAIDHPDGKKREVFM